MKLQHIKFAAQVQGMADDEVLGLISPRVIKDIRREDPTPLFKVFRVGQEGESRPHIVGIGATVQRWYQSAIEKLTEKLGLGIPVYHNHAPTNSGEGRQAIGEIVGKALKNIGGSLSSIAVAYIYPQYRDLPLDVASIEAGVNVPQDSREFDVQDVDVQEVTGIALGNSAFNKPAFPGATLMAQLQAFAGNPNQSEKGSGKMATLEDLRKATQEARFTPSQIFEAEDLTSDPVVRAHVKQEVAGEYAHRRRTDDAFDKARAEWEKKEAGLNETLQVHSKAALKTKARETFDAILTERPKLKEDARLVKFIHKGFDKGFQPTDEAKVKDELNKFVDDQVTEFTELMGDVKQATQPADKGKSQDKQADADGDGRDRTNLLDPRNNDLIPD